MAALDPQYVEVDMATSAGFWERGGIGDTGTFSHSLQNNRRSWRRRVARSFRGIAALKDKALMVELIGATTGGTAATTYKRAPHPTNGALGTNVGGLRTAVTVTPIDRATVAADVTNMELYVNDDSKPNTYPADRSGNGGGGKGGV